MLDREAGVVAGQGVLLRVREDPDLEPARRQLAGHLVDHRLYAAHRRQVPCHSGIQLDALQRDRAASELPRLRRQAAARRGLPDRPLPGVSDDETYRRFRPGRRPRGLAGHDGVGIQPVRNILSQAEINQILDHALEFGGNISYKSESDGSLSPYEININYFDMLSSSVDPANDISLQINRFITAHAIMFALRGVPGIYFHSLLGSRNWSEGVEQTGRYRTINRQKLSRAALESDLADDRSLRHRIFQQLSSLLKKRASSSAFHPAADQRVIRCHAGIFAIARSSIDGSNRVLCLHNVSEESLDVSVDLRTSSLTPANELVDLVNGQRSPIDDNRIEVSLEPYQFRWLQAE